VGIDLLWSGENVLALPEGAMREKFKSWHYFVSIQQVKKLSTFAL